MKKIYLMILLTAISLSCFNQIAVFQTEWFSWSSMDLQKGIEYEYLPWSEWEQSTTRLKYDINKGIITIYNKDKDVFYTNNLIDQKLELVDDDGDIFDDYLFSSIDKYGVELFVQTILYHNMNKMQFFFFYPDRRYFYDAYRLHVSGIDNE
ncbi:MAG: hypothetical protein K9H49_07085 [Bacteroidales bacterium]|nr:hypothetical protein [Bacteroidales bacterium]MCF8404105.1 hypothetical protein [Bacteroidales bacterium]